LTGFLQKPEKSKTCGETTRGLLLHSGCATASSESRLSSRDIGSDHIQVIAGGYERLLGFVVRNKSGVIIKGHIAFPAQAVKDDQQAGMFLV